MKLSKFIHFILIFFAVGSSCSKDSSVDPLAQWLGNWNRTYTYNAGDFDNNCRVIDNFVTNPFPILIITKSTGSSNKIDLSCTGFKTSAIVQGTTGIVTNVTGATFDTSLTLSNGKLTFTYRDGYRNSCSIYGSSYITYVPLRSSVELTK